MVLRISDWRCGERTCNGAVLAKVVEIERGWIERKCRKCGKVSHLGDAKSVEEITDLRCQPQGLHKICEASADWRGSVVIDCDRCKTESVIARAS